MWFFILLCAVFVVVTLIVSQKGETKDEKFDERQRQVRARCSQIAYTVLLAYVLLYGVAALFYPELAAVLGAVGILTGAALAVMVYTVLCVWRGAYSALNQRTPGMVLYLFCGAIGIANFVLQLKFYGPVTDGRLSICWLSLEIGIIYIVFLAARLARRLADRRAEEA
ncbi:MAG: hypothetical protein ACI3VB_01430 [Oscillospiraceae bacterium]